MIAFPFSGRPHRTTAIPRSGSVSDRYSRQRSWWAQITQLLPPPPSGDMGKLQPNTISMQIHKYTLSSSMKKFIKSADQKEDDNYPEINLEGTEIHNLNDREFKIAIIKNLSYEKALKDSSMKSGTKLMNRGKSSQKRLKQERKTNQKCWS